MKGCLQTSSSAEKRRPKHSIEMILRDDPVDHQLHHSKAMLLKKRPDKLCRYPMPEKPRQKRAVLQEMVRPLKNWLLRHRQNPYPTKAEKLELAVASRMSLVQVSNWFANARRRLKNVVQDPRCSWSKRLRCYNQYVQGNAELLSIASDDSIWNSDSEADLDGTPSETKDEVQAKARGVKRKDERIEDPAEYEVSRKRARLNSKRSSQPIKETSLNPFENISREEQQRQINLYKSSMLQRYILQSAEHTWQNQVAKCSSPYLLASPGGLAKVPYFCHSAGLLPAPLAPSHHHSQTGPPVNSSQLLAPYKGVPVEMLTPGNGLPGAATPPWSLVLPHMSNSVPSRGLEISHTSSIL